MKNKYYNYINLRGLFIRLNKTLLLLWILKDIAVTNKHLQKIKSPLDNIKL